VRRTGLVLLFVAALLGTLEAHAFVSPSHVYSCRFNDFIGCSMMCEVKKNAQSCRHLGYMYQKALDGAPLDTKKAMELYVVSCLGGYATACTDVGFLYDTGVGVSVNPYEAFKWYLRGCDEGDGMGCFDLGLLYENGRGTSMDLKVATAYHERACTMDNPNGCSSAGQNYVYGKGVAVDRDKGIKLLRKGCAAGNTWGCTQLDTLGVVH